MIANNLASLLGLLGLVCLMVGVWTYLRCRFLGQPWQGRFAMYRRMGLAMLLTLGGSLLIVGLMRLGGVYDRQMLQADREDFHVIDRLNVEFEPVAFTSADGTKLQGLFLPAQGPVFGTVIHAHGGERNVSSTVQQVHWLAKHGLHVLCFDYRGYGKSDGYPTRAGLVDDTQAAIEYVAGRLECQERPIGIWGQGMGGQLAIVASSRCQKGCVDCIVSESTFARHSGHAQDQLAGMGPLWFWQWAGWLSTSDRYSAEQYLPKLEGTSLVLVHGTHDEQVLPYHASELWQQAGDPKMLWFVEGAGHQNAFATSTNRKALVDIFQGTFLTVDPTLAAHTR